MSDTAMRGILLVSDLDGTLVTDKGDVPARNLAAIERFMRRGGLFAFATGRSVLGTERFAARIVPNAPCIVYNGGGIYDFRDKKLLWSESLPRDYGRLIREVRTGFPDVGIEIYSGGEVFYLNKNRYTKQHIAFQGIEASGKSPDDIPEQCNKILFCGDNDRLLEVSARLEQSEHPHCAFVFSGAIYYEVLPEGISKGATVGVLAAMLGIGADKIMSIGDYTNDLELLAVSALSAAPEDALEEVKSAADLVVCKCEDGAVADFIEYLEERFG
jgi:Cof subfamily protein (haloacid dehalogenase superfamily)